MKTDLLLCCAPVMSAVRPSTALGLLQATFRDREIAVSSLYLNLLFADRIGLDLNEALAEDIPNHLLTGDWLFAPCLGAAPERSQVEIHRAALDRVIQRKGLEALYEVRERHAGPFVAEAVDRILTYEPKVVGFTTMFEQSAASLAIAAGIKQQAPSTVVVFGGANCHGPMGAVLLRRYAQIDYVFTGEAELDFAPFVEDLLSGGAGPVAARGCLGRHGLDSPPAVPVSDMDVLPIPDYADYFDQLACLSQRDRVRAAIPFESSRGCWWGQKHHCTFCGLNPTGMAYRAKSPDRVVAEIEALGEAYGIQRFAATDNILSLSHVDGVLRRLAERQGADSSRRLFYEIKSNMDEAHLAALAHAGAAWVQPGIESLSDSVLKVMRKGVSALTNLRLMRNARELGIGLIWSILYGFPGEPPEDYAVLAAQLPLFEHMTPPNSCLRIRLDRFSPNYEQAAAIGFEAVTPMPAYGALFDVPEEDLADMAYFFEGYAPNAAREEDLVSLKAAVAAWRACWRPGAITPQLTMVDAGPGRLIKDTRGCAVEPLYFATGAELAVLETLRAPFARAKVPARLADQFDEAETTRALDKLVDRGFLVDIDGVVLTLVTEAGREVFDAAGRADMPHGYLLPPADADVARAPRADAEAGS